MARLALVLARMHSFLLDFNHNLRCIAVFQIVITLTLAGCIYAQQQNELSDSLEEKRGRLSQEDKRISTSTWIPILAYNKEQSQDGSYKTS